MTLGLSPQQSKLRLFQNRVLKSILDTERGENGEWITLHNDELHNFYSLLHNVMEYDHLIGNGYVNCLKTGIIEEGNFCYATARQTLVSAAMNTNKGIPATTQKLFDMVTSIPAAWQL
jgi:hypothetical protein